MSTAIKMVKCVNYASYAGVYTVGSVGYSAKIAHELKEHLTSISLSYTVLPAVQNSTGCYFRDKQSTAAEILKTCIC